MTIESTATPAAVTAGTLGVPGARLYYELRGTGPMLALVGAPMGAQLFAPLADLLADEFTVLTTDPRGVGRSPVDDPEQDSTPELRADDLARLLRHLDADPAVVFGSSGGAVTGLALMQAHPEQVRTVIAHEPPLEELLEDRADRRAATDRMIATYVSDGPAAAWAIFLSEANIPIDDGPAGAPTESVDHDPASGDHADGAPVSGQQGERDPQEVADEQHFFLHELRPTTLFEPDLAALRAVSSRIVVGIGEESAGQVCDLTSQALATELDTVPTMFPGGHIGFVEDPEHFATRLRAVIGGS